MTEPAANPDGALPVVHLDGRDWPIPELVVRQFRRIRKSLIDVTNAINPQFEKDAETGDFKLVSSTGDQMMKLDGATYDALLDCVYVGLTRAHPALTREEFDEFKYSDLDLFMAFLTVRRQSNIFSDKPSAGGAPPSGEAPAMSPTGT